MIQKADLPLVVCLALVVVLASTAHAQQDSGPRGNPAGAGSFYPTLNANEQAMFTQAMQAFMEVDSVKGGIQNEAGSGLGPTFNGNSCAQCHAQPAMGGSSPGLKSPQNPAPNPQVALATLDGATNTVPSFITADGPVREARFVFTIHSMARFRMAAFTGSTPLPAARTHRDAPWLSRISPENSAATT